MFALGEYQLRPQTCCELAREMITEEGMGDKLRNQVFNTNEVNFFGDKAKSYSEKTAETIDVEIEALTREATTRAETVLKANKKHLDALEEALLEKETLEEKEVETVLKGTELPGGAKLR